MKETKETKEMLSLGVNLGVGGILKGVADLVDKLSDLEELSRSGEFQGKDVKGVYGISVKVGLGDEGIKVEPFGNIRKEKKTRAGGEVVSEDVREPVIDTFEEEDHFLILAEMPGIGVENLKINLTDRALTIVAEKGNKKKYYKEIDLPGEFSKEKMTVSANNGVVEIKLAK